jgi:pimeloyl-ACP methyl ester carboxylesterase
MKTVVILHGWGHNSQYWKAIINMYERDFRVIFFDLPGFGSEPLVEDDWGVQEYANWVEKKIKDIPCKIVILGHSFGGRIATYIASKNPDYLEGLILSGAPSLYRPTKAVKLKIFLSKVLKKAGFKSNFYNKSSELEEADSGGMAKVFRKVVPFDQTDLLPNIKVPALLIWGEYDSAVPLHIAKEMNELISNSRLEIIEKVGHNSWMENLYLFYGLTKNFIQNI